LDLIIIITIIIITNNFACRKPKLQGQVTKYIHCYLNDCRKRCVQVFLKVYEDKEVTKERRQAVPDSRRSHSEDLIADCCRSGAPDNQFVTRRRSESLVWVIVNCPLQVSRQVFWCPAIAAAEHKNGQTERNTFWDAQPVQITQQRCNMVVFSAVAHQSCCSVKYWLQTIVQASRYSCRNLSVTVPRRWRKRVKLFD